ncbi:MAG: METTL5 family protein [Candidatus Poseidoniaceae archaeon]
MRPKHLAIELSKLSPHPQHAVELEQYATEGDLAAFFVLAIDQLDSISGKDIVDLGAGNGILGIGCGILGAENVTLIEGDSKVCEIAQQNCSIIMQKYSPKITTVNCMIGIDEVPENLSCDIVIMNPPWGFQSSKSDRPLLEYGFNLQPNSMYVIHSANATHLEQLGKANGYDCEIVFESNFRLPPKYMHQSRKMGETEVRCWRFHKPGDAKITTIDD